jgi:antitoxin CcdA
MAPRASIARRRKKAANLSVDEALLERARRLKLNLSRVFEAGLADAVRRHEREAWLKKNRAALEAYNEHLLKHGVFSDKLRSF